MDLEREVNNIGTREDLAEFIFRLATAAESAEGEAWENDTLPRFLEALGAWLRDANAPFLNQRLEVPEQPSWQFVGNMLVAGTLYE
jgi:hypothetical protein